MLQIEFLYLNLHIHVFFFFFINYTPVKSESSIIIISIIKVNDKCDKRTRSIMYMMVAILMVVCNSSTKRKTCRAELMEFAVLHGILNII